MKGHHKHEVWSLEELIGPGAPGIHYPNAAATDFQFGFGESSRMSQLQTAFRSYAIAEEKG
jgi:hypothetical protein